VVDCELFNQYVEKWKQTVKTEFPQSKFNSFCSEELASFNANLHPWANEVHPSSVAVVCLDDKCEVEGQIITIEPVSLEIKRLLRTISGCEVVDEHWHPVLTSDYDEVHFHVECEV
jgi:hypothetical protein